MTVEGGFVQAGPLRLHDTSGGTGDPPLLFIHGLGSSGYMEWRFNLRPMADSHRVYAPDLPGFGRSTKPSDGYGIPLFAEAVDGYMAARGIDSAVVVGSSMGGRVAAELALRHPSRVSRLVLVNSLGLGRPQLQLYYPLLLLPKVGEAVVNLIRTALHRASPAQIRRWVRRALPATYDVERNLDDDYLGDLREMHGSEGYSNAYLATVRALSRPASIFGGPDLVARLAELPIPLLIIWGSEDPLFPLAHAARAHAAVPGSRLAVISGAGHTPQAERPEEFNGVLADFAR